MFAAVAVVIHEYPFARVIRVTRVDWAKSEFTHCRVFVVVHALKAPGYCVGFVGARAMRWEPNDG